MLSVFWEKEVVTLAAQHKPQGNNLWHTKSAKEAYVILGIMVSLLTSCCEPAYVKSVEKLIATSRANGWYIGIICRFEAHEIAFYSLLRVFHSNTDTAAFEAPLDARF